MPVAAPAAHRAAEAGASRGTVRPATTRQANGRTRTWRGGSSGNRRRPLLLPSDRTPRRVQRRGEIVMIAYEHVQRADDLRRPAELVEPVADDGRHRLAAEHVTTDGAWPEDRVLDTTARVRMTP